MYIVEHNVSVLVTQASSASRVVQNALYWIHDLGQSGPRHIFGQSGLFKDKFKAIVAAERERASGVHQAFMSHKVDCALTCYPLLCDGAKCARCDGCKSFSGWRMYMSDCNRVLLLWHICLL